MFKVADTGIGIPADQQERIFETFHQIDGSASREAQSTGLGLSIARRFVEMHGGRIWVESEVGSGSTFHVALKGVMVASVDELSPVTTAQDVSGIIFAPATGLVVDAVEANSQVVGGHRRGFGLTVQEGGKGQEARGRGEWGI